MSYPPSQPESWPGSGQPGQWQPSYYQQPSYPAPPPPPPPRKQPVALWIGIGVLVVALLGGGAWLLLDKNKSNDPPRAGSTTSSTPRTSTKQSSKPPSSGDTKVVTSQDKKTEITVPNSWKELPEKFRNEAASIQLGDQRQERYVMIITDDKTDFDNFADFERAIVANTKEGIDDVELGEPRKLTVGNLEATQYVVTGKVDGLKVVYWFTLVDGKKGYHQVVAWTLPSEQAKSEGPIAEVIDSFREVGAP